MSALLAEDTLAGVWFVVAGADPQLLQNKDSLSRFR